MTKKENDSFTKKTTAETAGQRLDKFLTAELPASPLGGNITRSQIKKMILSGDVLINKKSAKVHQFLKEGDNISIANNQTSSPATTNKLFKEIKVIAEEPNFIIIEKPAGLLVHPTDKNEANTLIDWLLKKYPELKQIGEDPQRPALVHRLDKAVSGLMLIPRTQDAFDHFKKQFKERTVTKIYTALVYGEIDKDEDKIDFPIGRSKSNPGTFAARSQKLFFKDKSAITTFDVKKRFKNYTLLEIEILTGRTHQIRVHMLAYGHPVVGDSLYALRNTKPLDVDRIFLHAHQISFESLDGEIVEFTSPLPKKLQDIIKTLKS